MMDETDSSQHHAILDLGVDRWNDWRRSNPTIQPQLCSTDLTNKQLAGIDLSGADMKGADLRYADLSKANLARADLYQARLWRANLSDADLTDADLSSSNLNRVLFRNTNLSRAILRFARMVAADVTGANFSETFVYGCSFWNLVGTPKEQLNVVITPRHEPAITVDNIEVAQFIYMLLKNHKIREVIDTMTSKVVLILGRFTPERKRVLDAIREELRKMNYLPILFDFDKPGSRDLTETVSILAHMARFVIADITDAKSIPQELSTFVPHLPSTPVQPLLLDTEHEYGMFEHFKRYPWVLEPVFYKDETTLLANLADTVIAPAAAKAREQSGR
jgi:uncharacterized protein YjbI with pentapeptide repeats